MAGPSWRNEICARSVLGVALNRPVQVASRVRCPLLVQVGDHDTIAPPAAAVVVAERAPQAEVRRYPIEHFGVYVLPGQAHALADQVQFLRRHLAGSAAGERTRAAV